LSLPGALLLLALTGCGSAPAPASKEKTITWEEWKKMPPHEQNDPYVLERVQKKKKS
jgi:hypothetical protein